MSFILFTIAGVLIPAPIIAMLVGIFDPGIILMLVVGIAALIGAFRLTPESRGGGDRDTRPPDGMDGGE